MLEHLILDYILNHMESTGSTAKNVMFSVDQELVDKINQLNNSRFSIEEFQKTIDKCLAHEWIEHGAIGAQYKYLRVTQKGIGVAISRRRAEELQMSRSSLKKVSDYIENHKGLFVALGVLVGMATLALKLFGE